MSTNHNSGDVLKDPEDSQKCSELLQLARKFNCFYFEGYKSGKCKPLYCQGHQVGLVSATVEKELSNYPQVFDISAKKVDLCPGLTGHEVVSKQIDAALRSLRQKNMFPALRGWREETYSIRSHFSQPPLFSMERAATCMFGLRQYGVDINGYVVSECGNEISIWMQRRSRNKPTWPGRLDNFVSGGLSDGHGIKETVVKEALEEANLPSSLAKNIRPAGCVSFFFESERGIFPQTEFVFDLELPKEFVPQNNDGEVDEFILVPSSQVISRLCSPDMKTTSCPVTLDFLIRHGIISHETEPDLPELLELLHIPLHNLYTQKP